MLFSEVPGNTETREGFTSSEWEMCIYIVFFREPLEKRKNSNLSLAWCICLYPNCWQPEGEEIGVKVILNYKPVSRRAWDTKEPVYYLFSIAGINHYAQDNL